MHTFLEPKGTLQKAVPPGNAATTSPPRSLTYARLLQLQRTIGNRAVQRTLERDREESTGRLDMVPRTIQRQPAPAPGMPIRVKIGDSTRLNKDYRWHFDSIQGPLKAQLAKLIKDGLSFLPKEFPTTVEWGQFAPAELKQGGNLQIWLVTNEDPDLVAKVMALYGYSQAATEDAKNLNTTHKNENDPDDDRRKGVGETPSETADPKHDPMTARPVFVTVPSEFMTEIDPKAEGREKHSKDVASRGVAQLGYTSLHELGHALGLGHAQGNIGVHSEKEPDKREETFPPDVMDVVAAYFFDEYADAPNEEFSDAELKQLGGEDALRKNPIVEKIEIDPATHKAKVWLDLKKIKYSTDEQQIILNSLKNLVLFVQAADAARKKVHK